MESRFLNHEDYNTLSGWWKKNRFPTPTRDMLPQNGEGGIMVSSRGVDVCAAYLYTTNSKCAWVEWVVADFNYREVDRSDAILFLIESLKQIAKNLGFVYVYTTVKNPHLIEKYEACGFHKGDSNSQELIAILK